MKLNATQFIEVNKLLSIANMILMILGLLGVWIVTKNGLAILFTIIASLHIALPLSMLRQDS